MCGRFALTISRKEITGFLQGVDTGFWPTRGYNITPGQDIAAILNTSPGTITPTRWGLIPSWAKSPSIGYRLINARVETIHEKPSFKRPFATQRCLILANGFYEWDNNPETNIKTPYFFQLKSGDLFCFAGLWDTWKSPDNTFILSCTIITTDANTTVSKIHHRMPLVLKPESHNIWLSTKPLPHEALLDVITCYDSSDYKYFKVTREVNNPSFNNPEAIEEI